MDMDKEGYNVFVTGAVGTGRLSTVRKLLDEISKKKEAVPDDLCYVNNFNNPESPILLRLKAGMGGKFKKMELQTYDPFYLFTTTTIKPEPIEMDIKVIVISDEYLHQWKRLKMENSIYLRSKPLMKGSKS